MSPTVETAFAGLLGGNPFLLILGKLLDKSTDWKQVLADEGAAEVKVRLQNLWKKKGTPARLAKMAANMKGEGWSWEAAGNAAFLKAQKVQISAADRAKYGAKVNGFILSRDAVYRQLAMTGAKGGVIIDGWRDTVDNSAWEKIMDRVDASTPLQTIVTLTFEELVRVVL
jgi:hypothetical protein